MEHHYIVCSSYYSYLGLVNKSLAHVTKIQKKRVDPASISLSLHWLTSLKKLISNRSWSPGWTIFFLLFWRITGSVQDTTVNMGNQFRKLAHKANVVYYRWRAEIKDTGAPRPSKAWRPEIVQPLHDPTSFRQHCSCLQVLMVHLPQEDFDF